MMAFNHQKSHAAIAAVARATPALTEAAELATEPHRAKILAVLDEIKAQRDAMQAEHLRRCATE